MFCQRLLHSFPTKHVQGKSWNKDRTEGTKTNDMFDSAPCLDFYSHWIVPSFLRFFKKYHNKCRGKDFANICMSHCPRLKFWAKKDILIPTEMCSVRVEPFWTENNNSVKHNRKLRPKNDGSAPQTLEWSSIAESGQRKSFLPEINARDQNDLRVLLILAFVLRLLCRSSLPRMFGNEFGIQYDAKTWIWKKYRFLPVNPNLDNPNTQSLRSPMEITCRSLVC